MTSSVGDELRDYALALLKAPNHQRLFCRGFSTSFCTVFSDTSRLGGGTVQNHLLLEPWGKNVGLGMTGE